MRAAARSLVDEKPIRDYSERIAREFRPRRIILFGSYAYGTPTPDSDVDLLVVVPHRGKARLKALEIVKRVRPPFPLDLIVRSPAKLRRRIADGDWFLREVWERGRVLYEADHGECNPRSP